MVCSDSQTRSTPRVAAFFKIDHDLVGVVLRAQLLECGMDHRADGGSQALGPPDIPRLVDLFP